MAFVIIDEEDLAGKRPKLIQEFLLPLASENGVACYADKASIAEGRVFATHDGHAAGKGYRDWRFASKHRDIRCSYFERWKPAEQSKRWFLDRAYLTLFLTNRILHKEQELLCVHSDPNNTDSIPMQGFKKGPHLHVKHEEETLCHAHFPLTIGYVDEVVKSVPELTRVLKEVVSLLSIEVVERFEKASKQTLS
jgi:hypothetical protein